MSLKSVLSCHCPIVSLHNLTRIYRFPYGKSFGEFGSSLFQALAWSKSRKGQQKIRPNNVKVLDVGHGSFNATLFWEDQSDANLAGNFEGFSLNKIVHCLGW